MADDLVARLRAGEPCLEANGRPCRDEVPLDVRRSMDEMTFGYTITCHKAQGSQWPNVFIFDESHVFREDRAKHLYTAITRAAERVTVVL